MVRMMVICLVLSFIQFRLPLTPQLLKMYDYVLLNDGFGEFKYIAPLLRKNTAKKLIFIKNQSFMIEHGYA
jgi:hypothetical protein